MKNLILIIGFVLGSQLLHAQRPDPAIEFSKIKAYYVGPELKHIQGEMTLTDITSGKRLDNMDFEYWIKDTMVFTKMKYLEILVNADMYFMVNNKSKSIYARPLKGLPKNSSQGGMLFDARQFNKLLNTKGVKVVVNNAGTSSLNSVTLTGLTDPRFSDLTIEYTKDYKIKKITGIIKETASGANGQKLRLEIEYKSTEKSNAHDNGIFSSSRYILTSAPFSKVVTFNKKYEGYKKM